MSQLAPCKGCRRHVRVDETSCPFCGSTSLTARHAARPRVSHATRAAVFYLGATLSGCNALAPVYGGPPLEETIAQPYGAPPDPPPEPPPELPPEMQPEMQPTDEAPEPPEDTEGVSIAQPYGAPPMPRPRPPEPPPEPRSPVNSGGPQLPE